MPRHWIRFRERSHPRLCFARSDRVRTLGLAVDLGTRGLGQVWCLLTMDEVGHRGLRHATKGLAGRLGEALGSFVVVSGNVEGDEEYQVRGEDAHSTKGGELLAGAFAGIGPLRSVGRDEVSVGGEVDESCTPGQRPVQGQSA